MRINMRTNNSQAQRDNPACEERDFGRNRLVEAGPDDPRWDQGKASTPGIPHLDRSYNGTGGVLRIQRQGQWQGQSLFGTSSNQLHSP